MSQCWGAAAIKKPALPPSTTERRKIGRERVRTAQESLNAGLTVLVAERLKGGEAGEAGKLTAGFRGNIEVISNATIWNGIITPTAEPKFLTACATIKLSTPAAPDWPRPPLKGRVMRRMNKAIEARLTQLERLAPPEPQASPYDWSVMSIPALQELRDAINVDGTIDPATLTPATLAELEAARNG